MLGYFDPAGWVTFFKNDYIAGLKWTENVFKKHTQNDWRQQQ